MPKITKIATQKRIGRYNIYIDGRFVVGLSEKDLIEHNLYKDKEVTEKQIKKIKKDSSESKIKEKAFRLISVRPRSAGELNEKLVKKGYDEKSVASVLKKLIKEGYLNDKAFAKIWVENRNQFKPFGKRRLSLELRVKKVDLEIIEKELSKISIAAEIKQATELVKRKIESYRSLDKQKKKEKIIAFLQRRGFNWDVIKESITIIK